MLSVNPSPKSPLIEPGDASKDFVEPIMSLVVAIALLPSIIAATTLPDVIKDTSSPKNGFDLWSE